MHNLTSILGNYKVGQVVDKNSIDFATIAEAYGETSTWYNLNGTPAVFVGKVGRYGKCFYATDGIKTKALTLKMLSNHNTKHSKEAKKAADPVKAREQRVKQAFRKSVKCQIDVAISNTVWPHTCPLTGKVFQRSDRHLFHVDHRSEQSCYHPFSTILNMFLAEHGLTCFEVKLDVGGNLKGNDLERDWRNYHKLYADLVVVDASANMSKGAKRDQTIWR